MQYPPNVFDVSLSTEQNTHTLEIDTNRMYGYFENNHSGSGGGLWFEKIDKDNVNKADLSNLTLTDYDGTMALSMRIIRKLREVGITVEEHFE